jgi:homogentisate phytyltransferase/homogentisate geranylgeranyltransferase
LRGRVPRLEQTARSAERRRESYIYNIADRSSLMSYLYRFWKFSRPHTIIGTTLSVIAIYLLALATTNNPINLSNLGQLLGAWLACLCGNIYIVGLNQLYDVEIDKVNKPHLPLANGEFSVKQGKYMVGLTGVLAILLAVSLGIGLLTTVTVSLLIGTAYSLPPIRLKRFPLLAAICILTVRGIVVNVGLFLHFSQILGETLTLPPQLWILTLFIFIFTVAIAIFKDVPDMEGDKKYQIQTFTLLLGKSTVFTITLWVITFCYIAMIGAVFLILHSINTAYFVGYHLLLLMFLWWRSQRVNLDKKSEIADFYQFIWKLFFLEYILFPLAFFLPNS